MKSVVLARLGADGNLAPLIGRADRPAISIRPSGDRLHIDLSPDREGDHIRAIAASIRRALCGMRFAGSKGPMVLRYGATLRVTGKSGWSIRLVFQALKVAPAPRGKHAFR